MNDLTKYDGHTPKPWRCGKPGDTVVSDNPVETSMQGVDDVVHYDGYLIAESVAPCNRPLIVDAPVLLAEVKALREKLVQVSLCASNAQYGKLDMREAIYSIAEALEVK